MRGRPRARLSRTGSVGDIGVSSVTGSGLTSDSWSSVSSILGTISSDSSREPMRPSERESWVETPLESNVGVSAGESLLDDMEGWGDELMLRRACAADGGCPKLNVEIIRARKRQDQWLPFVVDMHWTSALIVEAEEFRRGAPQELNAEQ